MRALVYYVIGGAPDYAQLLRASVASLRKHHAAVEVDVAVLCDADYARHVHCIDGVRVLQTPPNGDDPVSASMRKMQAFRWVPDIRAYDVVLYLDCDTLVLGRLDEVLRGVSAPDKLYTCREEGPDGHTRGYWSLGRYTQQQLEGMRRDGVGTFNCGQFAFKPTPEMEAHFAAVCRLTEEDVDRRGFWEQAYANHHFNASRAVDDTVLTPCVLLAARKPPAPPGVVIAHFTDASMPWWLKFQCMMEWSGEQRDANFRM